MSKGQGALFCLICFMSLILLIAWTASRWFHEDRSWHQKEVEETLKASIPKHARNVSYEGHTGLGAILDLRFEALPDEVAEFTSHFCDGVLYQGFDPFHRIIVETETPYTHRINMGWFVYYAYSPDAPATLYGIRCPGDRLTVDQSQPDFFVVHLIHEFTLEQADEHPGEVIIPPISPSTPVDAPPTRR